jgi:NADPH-dependent curcumin reductase CurA
MTAVEQARNSENSIGAAARWVLARQVDNGLPEGSTFKKERMSLPALKDRQILVRTVYVSLEPHTIKEITSPGEGTVGKGKEDLIPSTKVGSTVPGYVLGQVLQTRDPRVNVGEPVQGYWGWQTHAIARVQHDDADAGNAGVDALSADENLVYRVNPEVRPVSYGLHILGELGITGYIGLVVVGQPKAGDRVFVSSAAGIVGGIAGQTAKNLGCRVVGSVGSATKAAYILEQLGFDAAVNYKNDDLEQQIDAACPDGIDIYYDNVGGHLSDLILQRLRPRARVVLCGATAEWSAPAASVGPRPYWPLIASRARVEGFYVGDHHERYDDAYRQVSEWVRDGLLTHREIIIDGFDELPSAFVDFLRGRYFGKILVRVASEPEGWR